MKRSDPDPDLDLIFADDPARRALANWIVPPAGDPVEPDPAFRSALRRRLMQEAWRQAGRPSIWRRLAGPARLAGAGAAVGVALIVVAVISVVGGHVGGSQTVTVASPLANAEAVALARPIELDFTQPMDHATTERAISIEPATAVTYQWQGNTLLITPVAGSLAPSTQYRVQVTAGAQAAGGTAAQPARVVFVTAGSPSPSPAPSPAPVPSPSPTPAALSGEHALGASGPVTSLWSPDGATVYVLGPGGALTALPAAGGEGRVVVPDGVSLFAVAPDGSLAYVRNRDLVAGQVTVSGAAATALGFRAGRLEYVLGRDVVRLEGSTPVAVMTLAEAPTQAWFSPTGDRLVSGGPSGLRLADLGAGREGALAPAGAGFGDWSPDGRRFAYSADGALLVADGGGSAPARLVPTAATSVSWSSGGRIAYTAGGGVQEIGADGSGARHLADGELAALEWSPSGAALSYHRGSGAFVGQVARAAGTPALSQDAVLAQLMDARQAGDAARAGALLDDAGRAAFGSRLLLTEDAAIRRWYPIWSQPGRVTIRLVTGPAGTESGVEETIGFVTGPTGQPLVHAVVATPAHRLAAGPQVLSVSQSGRRLAIAFDSDLDSASAPGSVRVGGAAVAAAADGRILTAELPAGAAGEVHLAVGAPLRDLNRRPVAPDLELDLALATPGPSPAPSPSPGAQT